MPEGIWYEICIREVLDAKWEAYFAPLTMSVDEDTTRLRGCMHDQAELFGGTSKNTRSGLASGFCK